MIERRAANRAIAMALGEFRDIFGQLLEHFPEILHAPEGILEPEIPRSEVEQVREQLRAAATVEELDAILQPYIQRYGWRSALRRFMPTPRGGG